MGFNYQAVANTVAQNNADRGYASALGTFLNTALQSYQQHLLNQQANQLMAQQNAPKAQAVLDADGNPVYGDGTSPADIPTQPQEQAVDQSLGYGWDTTPPVPNLGGTQGLQMRMALMQRQNAAALQQARVGKLMATMPGPDGLTAEQREQNALRQANQSRLSNQFQANQDRLTSTYLPRGTRAAQPAMKAPEPQMDSYEQLNKDFQATTGHPISDVLSAEPNNQHLDGNEFWVGGYSQPTTPGFFGSLLGEQATPAVPQKTLSLPANTYQQFMARKAALDAGTPTILNQSAINAAQAYSSHIGVVGSPAATASAAPVAAPASAGSSPDDQAAAWAMANPDDPRAAAIMQRLGLSQ